MELGDYVPLVVFILGAFVIFFLGFIVGRTQARSKDET